MINFRNINFGYLLILGLFVLTNCKKHNGYQPAGLLKVTDEELIEKARNQQFPNPESIVFKNQEGEVITLDSLQKMGNPDAYCPDYYQNEVGEIKEAIIRKSTDADLELRKKLEAVFNEGPEVNIVDIDCEDKINILNTVFERDQGMRRNGGTIDPQVDHENLEIIVSFIEKCGIPTLEEINDVEMAAIWATLQHAPARYQSKYIPDLEQAANKGDIKWSIIALMKDRALMYEGKQQIYGSQVTDGGLYNLFEPEYVNQRRAEIDMGPLEEYLDRFGIEFTVEQKTK